MLGKGNVGWYIGIVFRKVLQSWNMSSYSKGVHSGTKADGKCSLLVQNVCSSKLQTGCSVVGECLGFTGYIQSIYKVIEISNQHLLLTNMILKLLLLGLQYIIIAIVCDIITRRQGISQNNRVLPSDWGFLIKYQTKTHENLKTVQKSWLVKIFQSQFHFSLVLAFFDWWKNKLLTIFRVAKKKER